MCDYIQCHKNSIRPFTFITSAKYLIMKPTKNTCRIDMMKLSTKGREYIKIFTLYCITLSYDHPGHYYQLSNAISQKMLNNFL